jgi:hypothetical protein
VDAALQDRLYQLLAGREGKMPKTLRSMMGSLRRMAEDGFDFAKFASGEEAAQS